MEKLNKVLDEMKGRGQSPERPFGVESSIQVNEESLQERSRSNKKKRVTIVEGDEEADEPRRHTVIP